MDFEMLNAEMNNLLKLMSKEGPSSENYETYSHRLTELQEIARRWQELNYADQNQKEELNLRRREQDLTEEEIRARIASSRREARTDIATSVLGGVFTIGAIAMTQFIEQTDIIRTKGWGFINNLLRRV